MVSVKSIAAREKKKVATAKASIKTAKSRAKAAEKNLKTAQKELAKAKKVAGKNISKAKDVARKVKERAETKKVARRAASTPATAEKPDAVKDAKTKPRAKRGRPRKNPFETAKRQAALAPETA